MNALKVLTIDDEALALRRLKLLLQAISLADHVGEASSCREAFSKIETLRPDVILLDIKMRDGSGFDVLERLRGVANAPSVIFVSAYDEFAIRAFDAAVVDYLLKPVERDRLVRALERAKQHIEASDAAQRAEELQLVVRQLRSRNQDNSIAPFETELWLRSSNGIVRVEVDTIECVSSEDDYIGVHTPSGSHLMRSSIRQFIQRIEPGIFVRVHRRWLVRQSLIAELNIPRTGRPSVVLRNGQRLPAGRVYFKELRRAVQGHC